MKLWRVEIESVLFVATPDEEGEFEAEFLAKQNLDQNEPDSAIVRRVTEASEIPVEWKNALPFSNNRGDDKTCLQLIEGLAPVPPKPYNDPNQKKLWGDLK